MQAVIPAKAGTQPQDYVAATVVCYMGLRKDSAVWAPAFAGATSGGRGESLALSPPRVQSNRLDTDSSAAVRLIASAIRGAIGRVRMLAALTTASVGWIESVMTNSFSREEVMRVTAPPDSTPWVM